ncbi:MAG: methyl-accepting chemotaxis protein, partial [Chitinispirillia bacterium]
MVNRKSLSSSIIIRLLLSLTAIMFLVGVSFYFVNKQRIEKKVQIISEQTAERLAFSLVIPVWNMEDDQIETILDMEIRNEMFAGIVLKNNKEKIISTILHNTINSDTGMDDETIETFLEEKNYNKIKRDIINDKDTIGSIALFLTQKEVKRSLIDTMFMIILQLVITVVFIAFVIYFSIKQIILAPLKQILTMLRDIERGKGDLTKRISIHSENEFGELARLFNVFVDNIQNIIRSVIEKSNTLSSSSESLGLTADQFSVSSLRMQKESISVADSVHSTSERVGAISDAAAEMSNGMNTVTSSIEEISVSINEVAKNCQKESMIATNANTQAKKTQEIIKQLGESANHIGKIVDVINDIAD